MRPFPLSLTPAAALIAFSACSSGGETGASDPIGEAVDSGILSPGYLAGEWCYDSNDTNGDVEEQQITYRFAEDGSLEYQAESGGALDRQGSYEIGREGLRILPIFEIFPPMRARTIATDRLVLVSRETELFWRRGAC